MNQKQLTMKKAILNLIAVTAILFTSCQKESNDLTIDDFKLPGKVTKYSIEKMNDLHHPGKVGGQVQVPFKPEPIILELSDVDQEPNSNSITSNPIRIDTGCGIISANMVRTSNSLIDMVQFKNILTTKLKYPKLKECSIHDEIIETLGKVNNVTIQPTGEFEMWGENRTVIMKLMIVK